MAGHKRSSAETSKHGSETTSKHVSPRLHAANKDLSSVRDESSIKKSRKPLENGIRAIPTPGPEFTRPRADSAEKYNGSNGSFNAQSIPRVVKS